MRFMKELESKCYSKVNCFYFYFKTKIYVFNLEYRCDKIYQSVPRYLSTHCKQNIYIELNYYDLKIITAHRAAFDNVGLEFHVSENVIKIMKVPQCFQNKAKRTVNLFIYVFCT